MAGLALLSKSVLVFGQATLEIEPRFAALGSFSAQNPGGNLLNSGTTTFRISCQEPWSLYVTLVQPARRLSDNLELPLERVRQLFPDLAPLCGYSPLRLDYGSGNAEVQTVSYDWQPVQARIAQYLDEADPPGVYRFSVRAEVQNREGVTTSNRVVLVTEFTVLPQMDVELVNPNLLITVEHPGEPEESDPWYVMVRANSGWVLELNWGGDLVQAAADFRIDRTRISWLVAAGDDWESLLPAYTPVGPGPVTAARGGAPPPFTMSEAVIPLHLRVETDPATVAGVYATGLKVALHADDPAR